MVGVTGIRSITSHDLVGIRFLRDRFPIGTRIRAGKVHIALHVNIYTNNTAWFRFQADTGLQAAWTDPINSLFNSISPQTSLFVLAIEEGRIVCHE